MSNEIKPPQPVEQYVQTVNAGDLEGFLWTFADDAVIKDVNRMISGAKAVAEWARREIFDVDVHLEVTKFHARGGSTVVTMKIDGSFDRKGLPDPLLMDHSFIVADGRISKLEITFAERT